MIEKKQLPVAPWKGLYLDDVTMPGGLSRAKNIIINPDGSATRRLYERTLAESPACLASRGLKKIYELKKNAGTRYLFADVDASDTEVVSHGAELVDAFASWTAVSGWTYGSSKWTHTTGTTSLVATVGATPDFVVVAATKYRIVVNVTHNSPSTSSSGWVLSHVDSGKTWMSKTGNDHTIWIDTWTHTAASGTTALTAISDFTVVSGSSYRVITHVKCTAGTSISIYIGDTLAGTVSGVVDGLYEFVAPFVTTVNYTALRFVPTNDWAGTITKAWPHAPSKVDDWCSVFKFIDPAGANVPSNYDTTAGTHSPIAHYSQGAELLYKNLSNWYPEAAASSGQSLAIYLGSATIPAGIIQASGVYTFNFTATNTTTLKFVPTSAWDGTLNSFSAKGMTYGASSTETKVIGGQITGGTDLEISWANVLTNLTAGDSIRPQWATLQDRAFRCDGVNQNYWFSDASDYHTLGTPAPADAPVTANATTTGGAITAGTYNVFYTYVKKYGTYIVEGNPSPASNVTVANDSITVAVVACTDTDVTHIRIYRTLYSEPGSDAYLDREVNNATATITLTSYDDGIGDGAVLAYDNNKPPLFKYILGAGSRLWGIDTAGLLRWSKLDEPEKMPALNFQSFDPKDGDFPTGMCALKSYLLLFKRRRTWLVNMFSESTDANGNAMLAKDVISTTQGCVASGSIQPVGTDSAIWLSLAGFLIYDGGTIRNISAGDPNTGTPSSIQSVVNYFLANGAENFIESVYHSARRLYHVNFLYRNDDGTEITAQRHFVYNLNNPGWTEYEYTADNGDKHYETNFAMAHDFLGNEVILIPYLVTTTGTVTYIYQGDYMPDEAGCAFSATGQAALVWGGMCSDADDNVYAIVKNGDIYKNTGGFTGTFTALGGTSRRWWGIAVNNDTGDVYACTDSDADQLAGGDIYMQTAGEGAFVSLGQSGLNQSWKGVAVHPNGNVYACSYADYDHIYEGAGGDIYMQTAGTGDFIALGQTHRDWYGITITPSGNVYACVWGGDIYMQTGGTGNFVALDQGPYGGHWSCMASDDDGNVYAGRYVAIEPTEEGYVYKQTAGTGNFEQLDSTQKFWQGLACTSNGEVYATTSDDPTYGDVYVYLSEGYWEIITDTVNDSSTAPTMSGTIVDIVSNYEDLGISNDKRISRAYLPIESQYATNGAFTLEPDYGINRYVHVPNETTEPDGATSLRPFAHPGRQTWKYTNDQFDSTVEQWQSTRLDVGAKGNAFRYAIKVGDVTSANHGILRIRPPRLEVQVLGKP